MTKAPKNLDISTMTEADIAFACRMTDAERWGYLKEDFAALMAFEPGGCFIARDGERPVGLVTSTSYGTYAFVGTLIVDRAHRNAGIGGNLLAHAVSYLEVKGVTTVELDGVFDAAPLYRRLGFKDKYLSLRFYRPPAKAPAGASPLSPEPAREILGFDRRLTGIARESVLGRYIDRYSDSIYLVREGPPAAYAVVRPRKGGYVAVGPMVAKNDRVAEGLMTGIVATYHDVGISAGVPAAAKSMAGLLVASGFTYQPPSLRMYRGKKLAYENHIYAILSPEKG